MACKNDRYWEMRQGGPYDKGRQIFKCVDCGAETAPENGFNGEPDPGRCHHDCRMHHGDWEPGRVSRQYKVNFDRIFPDAPWAGL